MATGTISFDLIRHVELIPLFINAAIMPGRYVGTEEEIDDGIPFDEKMKTLTAKLAEQFAKGNELEKTIRENLKGIGYEL